MRKLVLLLVLAYPLVSLAQRNDIYFIPKKESKVVVVETDVDAVLVEDDGLYVEDESYVDDSYVYDEDDFRYSTRILRFRNSYSYVGSPLYWDLMYCTTYNGWYMYDNGYYIDIYPNYNSCWGWNSWYYGSWYNPWGYHHHYPSYHWNNHHHMHGGFRPPYIAGNSWRPAHKLHTNIPVRNGNRNTNVTTPARRENNTVRAERGERIAVNRPGVRTTGQVRTGVSGQKGNGAVRNNNGKTTDVRRQQRRTTTGGKTDAKGGAVRVQQPRRPTTSVENKSEKTNASDTKVRKSNERTESYSPSSGSSRNSYRSSSRSSGEYNRPSSTSVSRQRTTGSMSGAPRTNSVVRGGVIRK